MNGAISMEHHSIALGTLWPMYLYTHTYIYINMFVGLDRGPAAHHSRALRNCKIHFQRNECVVEMVLLLVWWWQCDGGMCNGIRATRQEQISETIIVLRHVIPCGCNAFRDNVVLMLTMFPRIARCRKNPCSFVKSNAFYRNRSVTRISHEYLIKILVEFMRY